MICPRIIRIESKNQEVPIFFICCTQNVFIHYANFAFDCTVSTIRLVRFEYSSIHHNKADRLSIIRWSCQLFILWPFTTNIFTIISMQNKIVSSISIYFLTL